jgi:hypothetical protein
MKFIYYRGKAQMSVKVDHLATDYLENYSKPSKIIPFIPPSHASLTIQGETINYHKTICEQTTDCSKQPADTTTNNDMQQLDRPDISIYKLGSARQSFTDTRTRNSEIHHSICTRASSNSTAYETNR